MRNLISEIRSIFKKAGVDSNQINQDTLLKSLRKAALNARNQGKKKELREP